MKQDAFEKIEPYLNGGMSEEECRRFEAEMAADNELAEACDLYKKMEAEMQSSESYSEDEARLKQTLSELGSRFFTIEPQQYVESQGETVQSQALKPAQVTSGNEPAPLSTFKQKQGRLKTIQPWLGIAVAASVLGIIAFSVIWYLQNSPDDAKIVSNNNKAGAEANRNGKSDASSGIKYPDSSTPEATAPSDNLSSENSTAKNNRDEAVQEEKTLRLNSAQRKVLFARHFAPDAAPEDKTGPLEDAFAAYEARDYHEAVTAIDNADLHIVTRGEEEDQQLFTFYAHYYKALSYMAVENGRNAIPELKQAMETSPDRTFKTKAQWYLALAYLKTGAEAKAEPLLKQLARNNFESAYKSKATALLKELKGG